MAQRFIGIDLSTGWVRVIELIAGPRSVAIGEYHEQPIAPPSEKEAREDLHKKSSEDPTADGEMTDHTPLASDWPQRAGAALLAIGARIQLRGADAITVGINAPAHVSVMLTLPFDDPKVIAQVLPGELETRLPLDEEHVTDFMVLGPATEGGFETLVIAARPSDIDETIRALNTTGIDPQVVTPLVFAQQHLLPFLNPDAVDDAPYLVLNIGAHFTHCTIAQGDRLLQSRTLILGGETVTQSLSQTLSVSLDAAESFKCARGFVAPPGQAKRWAEQLGVSPGVIADQPISFDQIATASIAALRPMMLGVRQMLAGFTARTGKRVQRVWLTGDGAKLPGIAELIQNDLQLEAAPLLSVLPPGAPLQDLTRAHGAALVAPLALALTGRAHLKGDAHLNLRQGRFSFRGGFDFLRDHALSLSLIAACLLGAIIFTIFARFNALSAERDHVQQELSRLSKDLFGVETLTTKAVNTQLESVSSLRAIPERSAYYHLAAMGTYLSDEFFYDPPENADPSEEPPNFEIRKLIINLTTKNISIEAAVSPDGALQKFKRALSSYRCFPANIEEIEQVNDIEIPTYTRVKFVFTTIPNCTGE
jgi:Tfp pilus assembly PilM family ATPase